MSQYQLNKINHLNRVHPPYAKRRKTKDTEDKYYLDPIYITPKEGYPSKDTSIIFEEPEEQEYFSPFTQVSDPVEQYKIGLKVDKLAGVKRLKDPNRWCVLPLAETTRFEVPLTPDRTIPWVDYEVVQELGHVAWFKAVYHVDQQTYKPQTVTVEVVQVLKKIRTSPFSDVPIVLPTWKKQNTPWNLIHFNKIEIPSTVYCFDKEVLLKLKYCRDKTVIVLPNFYSFPEEPVEEIEAPADFAQDWEEEELEEEDLSVISTGLETAEV